MIQAGVNVCRINSSHGNHDLQREIIANVRAINKKLDLHTAILVDLQGPKLRVGEVENNAVELINDKELIITTHACVGSAQKVSITYPDFPKDVKTGERILLDDGKLELTVLTTNGKDEVVCQVTHGGTLSSRKGVNLPNTKTSLPSLTEKDLEDLDFALEQDVDWIGLSFVRSEDDIRVLKEIIARKGKEAFVIAKIEKPEAIEHIDAIIAATDALMVARGDLGVEVEMSQLPHIQKMLVRKCIKASKPVIIATQMMESMIVNYSPTRAEVNDVANAVLDGADAVMLSAETSVGKYPVGVVEQMYKIITRAEQEPGIYDRDHDNPINTNPTTYVSKVVCFNACKMAEQINAQAIVTMTHSGYTAYKISSYRPKANLYVFTDNPRLLSNLTLVWGARGFYYNKYQGTDETFADLKNFLKENGYLRPGDFIINLGAMPLKERGRANMLKLGLVE